MADDRVRLTLPKRFRPILDRLTEPTGMGHTEFVSWLIDSYNARDLAFLPLVTSEQLSPPKTTSASTQASRISEPATNVVVVETAEDDSFDDAF